MARSRELYMDIDVAGRNFERKDEILTLQPENIVEVLDAYFAEAEIEKVFEGKEDIYTVQSGDNLERIATKKGTTAEAIIESDPNITEQNKNSIQVGQEISLSSQTEKGEKINFKRLNKTTVGKEAYIIVKTKDFANGTLKINVKQGKKDGIAVQDKPIPVTVQDKRKVSIEAKVESLSSSEYLNKTDYEDMAIVKITFDPGNKNDLESWQGKLEELDNKKTFLYLLVDAHSNNADKEVIYHGRNPNAHGEPDKSSKKNRWLDMEDKWFELSGCSCCTAEVDQDGFVNHSKFTKKQITQLEKGNLNSVHAIVLHRTVNSSANQTFDSFENGIGTHFLVGKDGKIYQTASLNKLTYHVGKIKSKCYENNSCSEDEQTKIKGWGWAPTKIYNHEKKKSYPDRYPMNQDSIGIEVVGDYVNEKWDNIPDIQVKSVVCVVNFLLNHYNLKKAEDIYEHEDVSYKTEGEGSTVHNAIKNLLR